MAYYTYHDGKVIDGPATEREVAIAIAKLTTFESEDTDFETIDTINDVIMDEPMKWYHCIEDMKKISLQFPDTTIFIHGEGEDQGDLWDAYFRNGKAAVYKAEIIYPEFDEEDLK